jgi:biopolymer transport protein ExbB/TolQ
MKPSAPAPADHARRTAPTLAAFVVGLPLAALVLGLIQFGPLRHSFLHPYVEHPVEWVEVLLFCCALGALGAKLRQNLVERRACARGAVPAWDGRPVPADQAPDLLQQLHGLPKRLQNTYLAQRVAGVLDFLCQRRSTDELDDHLRTLVDSDSLAMEGSYALTRFITWAIPILGFLGTVLGITQAISGIHSDDLQIGSITGGLANAFNATALGLALTMVTMFVSFLVERQEQAVLDAVDRYVERELAHRFQRLAADSGPFVSVVQENTRVVLDATARVVQQQADIWAKSLAETERRAAELRARQEASLAAALEQALEKTLRTHEQRLAALEKQAAEQGAQLLGQMARVAEGVSAAAGALARLQEGEKGLAHLQGLLQQNLAALAGAGSFEQAVHTLTAAIHLLTARAAARAGEAPAEAILPLPRPPRPQPGRAA